MTTGNVMTTDASLVGSHFLTSDDGEHVLAKIELDQTGDVSPGANPTIAIYTYYATNSVARF
jgi:hypothetical protein